MNVASSSRSITVGVRDLKNGLSRYLGLVAEGYAVIITDRGRPVARLEAVDSRTSDLAELISSGLVQAPLSAARKRPARRIAAMGDVSSAVSEQR